MKLYNIKVNKEQVSFTQAVKQGLGQEQGLFFPSILPKFDNIDALLEEDFISRSSFILSSLIGDELPFETVRSLVENAFIFPVPVVKITQNISALELFHGPTLAFKDFGARFMAQSLAHISHKEKITILTATSGDTGAAVAHAFYGMTNVNVVILYPKNKISQLQEKLFTTLGNNIHSIAINGTFDDCQSLVKQAFDDENLKEKIGLNSANSINISRLMAQICYYFEAGAQLTKAQRKNWVVAVPCGNFGNLTAGMIAKAMGLPIKRFVAATNSNDTIPYYLATGKWRVKQTQATLSNSMDVSLPNNWPRVELLCQKENWSSDVLTACSVSEDETIASIIRLFDLGYLCEPHGAVAFCGLTEQLKQGEQGMFLCTAHPAKFKQAVDDILHQDIALPETLASHDAKTSLSIELDADFSALKMFLARFD